MCLAPELNQCFFSLFQFGGDLGISVLMERMKKLTESECADMTSEEMLQQFENVENQSAESMYIHHHGNSFKLILFQV